jgi:ABC-type polysaccharide/polyol phosphate export permease
MKKQHVNLLILLAKKNFKNSDYHSLLGILWSFIGPAATFVVTYAIFNQRMGQNISFFPLRLMIAIILISYFTRTCGYIMKFLRGNSQTLLNTNIPFEILLLSNLFVPSLKFVIELTLCCLVSIFLRILNPSYLPTIVLLSLFFSFFVLGFGFLLCLLYSLAADIEEIWIIGTRLLIFITPVFYTLDMLSDWGRFIVTYGNPLTPFVLCFQTFITNQKIPYYDSFETWTLLLGHTGIFFFLGYFLFIKYHKKLLEVV